MVESIIVACITGILSLIGVIYNGRKQHEVTIQEIKIELEMFKQDVQSQVDFIKKDINSLEKKQDVHNGVIERVYNLEKCNEVQDEKIKNLEKRVG